MKKILGLLLVIGFVISCKSDPSKNDEGTKAKPNPMPVQSAEELEKGAASLDKMIEKSMPNVNQEQYIAAINTHYQLSQNYPENEKAAHHLDKAQGYCTQIKDFARSEKMQAQLFRDYPEYVKANNGEMYYVRASNLDFILGENPKNGRAYKKEAKRLYQEFIEKFPENPLVEEAKYRLGTMDLSAEDIVKNAKK